MGNILSDARRGVRSIVADRAFWPRAAILVGVGATITMNITAGLAAGPGSAVLAALIPVVFVIALESFIVVIRNCTWPWWIGAGLVLVPAAGIAGWVSWLHGHQVCLWTHNPDPQAKLIPFLPDLLIVCGTVALVALKVALVVAAKTKTTAGARQEPQPATPAARNPRQAPKKTKTAKDPRQAAAPQPLSAHVLAHLTPAQIDEEQRITGIILKLPELPQEREIARDYCNGNRGMAKRILTRAVVFKAAEPANWPAGSNAGEPQPEPAMNGHRKD